MWLARCNADVDWIAQLLLSFVVCGAATEPSSSKPIRVAPLLYRKEGQPLSPGLCHALQAPADCYHPLKPPAKAPAGPTPVHLAMQAAHHCTKGFLKPGLHHWSSPDHLSYAALLAAAAVAGRVGGGGAVGLPARPAQEAAAVSEACLAQTVPQPAIAPTAAARDAGTAAAKTQPVLLQVQEQPGHQQAMYSAGHSKYVGPVVLMVQLLLAVARLVCRYCSAAAIAWCDLRLPANRGG